jgi:site-specific DNA-methyltransferase (adenine-specific)
MLEYTPSEIRKMRNGRGGVWRIPQSFGGYTRNPVPRFTVLTDEHKASLYSFFREWGEILRPKLVPGAHVLIAANPLLSHAVAQAMVDAGYEMRGEIVRLTKTLRGGDRPKNAEQEFADVTVMPKSQWEPWVLLRNPCRGTVAENLRKWRTGGLRRLPNGPFPDVIQSRPTHKTEKDLAPHPTLKPQSFLRVAVRAILPFGEGIVLDPFAGSGSTLAACEALGYRGVGVELDPEFIDLAREAIPRLSQLSLEPVRQREVRASDARDRGTRPRTRASGRPTR